MEWGRGAMFSLISEVGWTVFWNVIQIAVGCILAVVIYMISIRKYRLFKRIESFNILVIVASSLFGLLLPLGTYGVIPIALMLLTVGVSYINVLPLVFSNAMFNMLVSFVDPSFSWKSGLGRIILAFSAGIISGIIFEVLKNKNDNTIRLKAISFAECKMSVFLRIVRSFSENINKLGLYLVVGAIINAVFHMYLAERVISFIFINSFSHSLSLILKYDIANPFFQYTYNLFVNFTALAAFVGFLRVKAIFTYIAAYSVLSVLFSLLVF